jgi:bHLH factor
MAEVHHPDLAGLPISPAQKRKRGTDSVSPDSRRPKRGVAAVTMAQDAAFIESAVSTAQAVHGHVNVEDLSALQQATAEPSDAADPANASSTAAAALGSMYPTLHVPPSTEETFAAQVSVEHEHHQDHSFNSSGVNHPDGLPAPAPVAPMPSSNGVPEQRFNTTTNPKPAVGSEEWHKMRKDNHKEGGCPS